MPEHLVAIVGRPNVGKSALFNRIVGSSLSIVDDMPGITRDRIYGVANWFGRRFNVVDTGGIETEPSDTIASQMKRQAEIAIDQADVLVYVVDSRTGLTTEDDQVVSIIRRSGKPVVIAASKVDDLRHMDYDLYSLGLGEVIATSAVHGIGIGDLVEAVIDHLPPADEEESSDDSTIKIAVIGRPNVGKSSLVNRVLGEERSIVSNVPGTTRDSIDASFVRDGQQYIIIDTAGIRRRGRIEPGVEKYSVVRAYRSVDRCDVALTVLDGTEDPAAQDVRIAGYAHEAGKASVVVVNKWDIVERDESTARDYESKLRLQIDFMPYAPVVFASALTGRRIGRVLDMVRECALEHRRRVPTADVNRVLQDALMRNPVPTVKGKEVKIFYASQVSTRPPHFMVWANYPELVHFSYQRYLENTMRNAFGFTGTPIQVTVKRRGQ